MLHFQYIYVEGEDLMKDVGELYYQRGIDFFEVEIMKVQS